MVGSVPRVVLSKTEEYALLYAYPLIYDCIDLYGYVSHTIPFF